MRRRILTLAAAVAVTGALAGCGTDNSGEFDLVTPESGLPTTEAEVVTEWVEVENPYANSYFRVIRLNGVCFVEELHRGYPSLTEAPEACER